MSGGTQLGTRPVAHPACWDRTMLFLPVVSRPGRKFERCQHPSPSDCPAHQRQTLFFPVHQEVPKTLQWVPGLTVGLCTGSCTGGQQTFPRIMTGGPEGVRTTTWAQDCCAWPGTTGHLLSSSLAEMGTGCSHGHRVCWWRPEDTWHQPGQMFLRAHAEAPRPWGGRVGMNMGGQ